MSTLEKVFRRLAEGRGVDAIQLIEAAFKAKEEALSISQAAKAKAARSQHPVNLLVKNLVMADPAIDGHTVLLKLKRAAGHGVIHEVNDTEIVPSDKTFKPRKRSGLKDLLFQIKKKLSQEPASAKEE